LPLKKNYSIARHCFVTPNLDVSIMATKKTSSSHPAPSADAPKDPTKRDFLAMASGAVAVAGAAGAAWPLLDSLRPAADVLALSTTEVDLSKIPVGQSLTVMWRGKPVFVKHRTAEEIAAAKDVNVSQLPDPETDDVRVKKPEWLVAVGVCTHLGCVPTGQGMTDNKGEFNGWFCPCHGSAYDTSGRIRKGPAPKNLVVPPYAFLNDTTIKIG
jgi:ubiquinol-cytochrome c reductase iron-sulfur subunit